MTDRSKIQTAEVHPEPDNVRAAPTEDVPADNLLRISTDGVFELAAEDALEIHPAAEAFPLLPEKLDEMIESIRISGQMDPVTVYERRILDGRTRNLACKALRLPLKCRELTDLGGLEPLEWVVLRNLAAGTVRHLSDSQRALIAAELCVKVYQPRAEERRRQGSAAPEEEKGLASEKAARVVNVAPNRVRQALTIHQRNWDCLRNAVWSGHVGISTAARIAKLDEPKDRKRALTAAEQKDQTTLRRILNRRTSLKDALGRAVDDEIRPVFDAATSWSSHIAALRRAADWLDKVSDQPAARVLKGKLQADPLKELVDNILASRPWCQCPYCEQFSGAICQVCEGSGWLTESEYHRAGDTAASLFVGSLKQQDSQEAEE